jgi:hypothetical protein
MVIVFYGVEIDVLNDLDAPDRDKVLTESAEAYRARAKVFQRKGQREAAQADERKADKLEAEAKKLAQQPTRVKEPAGETEQRAKQVAELQKQVAALRAELQSTREAQRPSDAKSAKPAAETGQIEFSNAWNQAVTVIVDGVPYVLAAGKTWRITKPAGPFTYEVRDVQLPVERQLKAGATFAIRIEP